MQYWLMKSEPNVWSIDQQKKAGESLWRPNKVLDVLV